MDSQLKIGIIGAGGVGQTLAVALASEDYDVEVASRSPKGIRIDNACSFSICGDLGDKTYLIPTVDNFSKFKTDKDIIIIATKAKDAIEVMDDALSKLNSDGAIVTIQNSFFVDSVLKHLPSDKSICMYLDMSCTETDQGVIVNTSGGITLGVHDKSAYPKMEKLSKCLSSIIDVETTCDVFGFALGRNILNWAIAGLGAISGMTLGEMLSDRNGRYLFCKIIEEVVALCKRFKVNILPYNGILDYDLFTEKSLQGMLYRRKMMKILRTNNPSVKSSALNDLEKGKTTELEFLLAKVIYYGNKFKTPTAYINAIYLMIKEIEAGTRRIEENAFYDKMLVDIEK